MTASAAGCGVPGPKLLARLTLNFEDEQFAAMGGRPQVLGSPLPEIIVSIVAVPATMFSQTMVIVALLWQSEWVDAAVPTDWVCTKSLAIIAGIWDSGGDAAEYPRHHLGPVRCYWAGHGAGHDRGYGIRGSGSLVG
jgi:hypothetical protein